MLMVPESSCCLRLTAVSWLQCKQSFFVYIDEWIIRRLPTVWCGVQECMKQMEQDMAMSFAVQRSEDRVCSICMEVVWHKQPVSARRFGILSHCTHVYCLDCIRKWRSAKQFENIVIRCALLFHQFRENGGLTLLYRQGGKWCFWWPAK